jgi:hypothetical protein
MLKKILIAAVAVIAGTVVLGKVTGISPRVWLTNCCQGIRKSVPPEKKLEQLKADIESIDSDISKNISRLARMSAEIKQFEAELNDKRDRQAHLRTDISDMQRSLKDGTQRVFFRGDKVDGDKLTRRLDMTVTEFTCLKEQIKAHEQLLTDKKNTLEAAHNRLAEMKNEKEKLRVLAAKLETHLELVKLKQIQNQVIDFDDSAVTRARQTAKDIETTLLTAEEEMKIRGQYGLANKSKLEKEELKSRSEVLQAAKAALQEDSEASEVTVEKKE